MTNIKDKKTTVILLLSLAAGISAGLAIKMNGNISYIPTAAFPPEFKATAIKDYILQFCRTAVIESVLIFISGFSFYPMIVCSPVFVYRGAAIALSIRSVGLQGYAAASIISYSIATVLLALLAYQAVYSTREKQRHAKKTYFRYTYSFLMISGAIITVRIIPQFVEKCIGHINI